MIDHKELFDLLPSFSSAFAPTGCEKRILDRIKEELHTVCDCSYDKIGNLICHLHGKKPRSANDDIPQSYAFITGVDEIGYMITKLDDKGYLRIDGTGSNDTACFVGKRMVIGNEERLLEGIGGAKVLHLLSGSECSDAPGMDKLFIDLGCKSKDELEGKLEPGDFAAYKGDYFELPGEHIVGKALECRANCAILVTLLKQLAELHDEERHDIYAVFAVKEKIGYSGAVTALYNIHPDRAVILGFEPSCDLNEKDEDKKGAILGKGPVLVFRDGRTLYYDSDSFFERAKNACGNAPCQLLVGSQTLSGSRAHLTAEGTPMVSFRLPCHNPETPYVIMHKKDIEWTLNKLRSLAEDRDDENK